MDKSKSASDYSEIIPLALAVYLVGGGDAIENLMKSLLKEAVFGMAQNAGGIKSEFSSFFENADQSYKSLLYLSQDMDLNDAAYGDVKRKAQEKGLDLKNYAGSTQLLNSFSKLNAFDHPAYNAVYSYGLPSIGNGRRTLADFADQAKNHVDKERLGQMLTESVSATLAENGIRFAPEDVGNIVSNAVNGDFTSDAMSAASQYVENTGAAPVNGFEVRYYYRDSAETELDINWNEFASVRKINAGGDLNYASFVYEDVILNAGEKSDYGNGVQFALHHPNWADDFNADDDPSHYNLKSGEMAEADSVLILDRLGNLLWGHAPQPKFGTGYVVREKFCGPGASGWRHHLCEYRGRRLLHP